jgi:hypothetical protein
MTIAGCDYSTHAVDIVLLDEDTDAATWHRFPLAGRDAFERARYVRVGMPGGSFWDDVLAVGIEEPRGYNAGALYRVQGAILARIPLDKLVQPLGPSEWRRRVGLSGNASKGEVKSQVITWAWASGAGGWPLDACDAYCIALATRSMIQVTA